MPQNMECPKTCRRTIRVRAELRRRHAVIHGWHLYRVGSFVSRCEHGHEFLVLPDQRWTTCGSCRSLETRGSPSATIHLTSPSAHTGPQCREDLGVGL